jgi:transposase
MGAAEFGGDPPRDRRYAGGVRGDRVHGWRAAGGVGGRFVTRRDVPYTNNACERALRPSVIFRKVTGGFRAEWGAKVYAAAASVIATGRLHGLTALAAMRAALAGGSYPGRLIPTGG